MIEDLHESFHYFAYHNTLFSEGTADTQTKVAEVVPNYPLCDAASVITVGKYLSDRIL